MNETPEKPKTRTKKEMFNYMKEIWESRPNKYLDNYTFNYRDAKEKEFIDKILEEQVALGVLHKRKQYKTEKYVFVKLHFKTTFDKGIFTFEHLEKDKTKNRGIATYDINTDTSMVNGKKKSSLVHYFKGYSVRHTYYCYYNQINMREDIRSIGEYGEFLCEKIFDRFNNYTSHDFRNLGKILPFLKKFENMFNWHKCGIKVTSLIETEPSKLSKSARTWLEENKVEVNYSMCRVIERDVEHFKNLITLIQEERIPNNLYYSNWQTLLESTPLVNLIQEENYDLRAIIRYIYNYLIPYEKLDAKTALTLLRDYASMHRQMEVPEFKRYPKYLKSNHDIIKGEFDSFKKEYPIETFKKNVNAGLGFVKTKVTKDDDGREKEEIVYCVEVPMEPEELRNEGKILSHCVGSYIERVMNGQTQILFLRKVKGTPMVTLECRENVLIQAKGYANRNITKEEKQYIHDYAREKQLLVRI